MKIKLILSFIYFPLFSFGQFGHRFLPYFFNGNQPNAAAEAMGKAYVSLDGDLGSINYNPAGIASIKKIQVYSSFIPPRKDRPGETFSFYGFNYKILPSLNVALSHTYFDLGSLSSNLTGKVYREKFTLTLSSEPIKNLLVGINTNYFRWREGYGPNASPFYFDFGVIKKLPFTIGNRSYYFNLGSSITNFTGSSTANESYGIVSKFDLPIKTRYGISFETQFGKNKLFDSGSALILLLQSDYQLLLNSKYQAGIKVGGQITIMDLLSIRAGYFEENNDIYDFPEYNKSEIKSFTYGAGLQLPLNTIIKIPLKIYFDYTHLPHVNRSYVVPNRPDWSVYTFRLDYQKSKK